MVYDIAIIGAGLSGLFAGCLAARRRKKTLILARGVGGTHIGAGTIGVADDPSLVKRPPPDHPYAAVGKKAIQSALDEFQNICAEAGYPMRGEFGKNFALPTAAGGTRRACLIPETMHAGDLSRHDPFAIANFPNFRDLNASLAASNLQSKICNLQLPRAPALRDSYATDIARLFDRPDYRDEVIAAWEPSLAGAPKRLGLPAVLGLKCAMEAKRHLESALGIEAFEIPILPPSVPGMRLFNLLRDDFQNHGGRLIIGPTVKGRIENGAAAVSADTNGRVKEYTADVVFLASGGFLNGGLVAEFDGAIRESAFGLPIEAPTQRSAWTSERFLGPHPFAKFGVRVNKNMQPLDANGKPAAPNLRAIGSLLAGADRLSEGSREGIELATAWRAIETAA